MPDFEQFSVIYYFTGLIRVVVLRSTSQPLCGWIGTGRVVPVAMCTAAPLVKPPLRASLSLLVVDVLSLTVRFCCSLFSNACVVRDKSKSR